MDLESYRLGAYTSVVSLFRIRLVSEDPPVKDEPVPDDSQKQQTRSGLTYSLVTRHWPRIAAGLVVLLGVVELVLGGLTADSSVEFYLMAWAGTTGGLWFIFEKAERALAEESREKVVAWLGATDFRSSIEAFPRQFAGLFDRVFGVNHFSVGCFYKSCIASLTSVAVVTATWSAVSGVRLELSSVFMFGVIAVFLNLLPDYASLLETRWAISWMDRTGRIPSILLLDLVLTATISVGLMFLGGVGVYVLFNQEWPPLISFFTDFFRTLVRFESSFESREEALNVAIYFYSAFFTSVWLWLYAASVMLSRILLRMNKGVGFLLRVTDVERQPFRSMGFVSVLIVSALFLLGLPLVLLG